MRSRLNVGIGAQLCELQPPPCLPQCGTGFSDYGFWVKHVGIKQ